MFFFHMLPPAYAVHVQAMPPVSTIEFSEADKVRVYGSHTTFRTDGVLRRDFLTLSVPGESFFQLEFEIDRKYDNRYFLYVNHSHSFSEKCVTIHVNGLAVPLEGAVDRVEVSRYLIEGKNEIRFDLVKDSAVSEYGIHSVAVQIDFNPFGDRL